MAVGKKWREENQGFLIAFILIIIQICSVTYDCTPLTYVYRILKIYLNWYQVFVLSVRFLLLTMNTDLWQCAHASALTWKQSNIKHEVNTTAEFSFICKPTHIPIHSCLCVSLLWLCHAWQVSLQLIRPTFRSQKQLHCVLNSCVNTEMMS